MHVSKPIDPEGEWWELWDDIQKMPYYYHTLSNQTRWIHPPAPVISLIKIQQEVGSLFPFLLLFSSCSPFPLQKDTLFLHDPTPLLLSTTPPSGYIYVCVLTCHADL